jgi:hypothetical protein
VDGLLGDVWEHFLVEFSLFSFFFLPYRCFLIVDEVLWDFPNVERSFSAHCADMPIHVRIEIDAQNGAIVGVC